MVAGISTTSAASVSSEAGSVGEADVASSVVDGVSVASSAGPLQAPRTSASAATSAAGACLRVEELMTP
ncbi:hypothetical protein C8046_07870 [Serinibacter arcticus]|uniref:Uncharacterized protein n=1 Tax=Serinibacter arcticus TaxID=1655435 RepID=A0A2U1ZUF7_9MICO|nr:hypothetical protein [Serinibacter arcticus]PWD50580.1 hypothetical protein C8046_07870 [Serinibacter arcticus]